MCYVRILRQAPNTMPLELMNKLANLCRFVHLQFHPHPECPRLSFLVRIESVQELYSLLLAIPNGSDFLLRDSMQKTFPDELN
jgi:hypothetical protein